MENANVKSRSDEQLPQAKEEVHPQKATYHHLSFVPSIKLKGYMSMKRNQEIIKTNNMMNEFTKTIKQGDIHSSLFS